MKWERGLNFSQKKYKLINARKFVPHLRSNLRAAIPRQILENFKIDKDMVALLKIKDGKKNQSIRIKKLFLEGNSYTFSLKAEKSFKKPRIEVLDIKPEKDILSRKVDNPFLLKNFIPKYTNSTKNSTPIYVFDYDSKLIVGGYYKKDLLIKNKLDLNEINLSALGLYFAEGGKTASSFTNSWPHAINPLLDFVEDMFNLKREKIKASICCNYSLNDRQKQLESFWKNRTGISNFSRSLHFNKNAVSPQGILELYFCSEVIKSVLISIINKILEYNINILPLLKGIFSGDASPVLQNMYCITHNLSFNNNEKKFCLHVLKKAFPNTKISIIGNRFILYLSWKENRKLLFADIYRFNPPNRAKFAKQFFSLPKTKKMLSYDFELQEFLKNKYPIIVSELLNTYRGLVNLGIQNEDFIKEKEREWII